MTPSIALSPKALACLADRLVDGRPVTAAECREASLVVTALGGKRVAIARRDAALRRLAADLSRGRQMDISDELEAVRRELKRYLIAWNTKDQYRMGRLPVRYAGTPQEHLFDAYEFGGGKVPMSPKHLERILR